MPGVAQRVVRGIALLFHDRGIRRCEWSGPEGSRKLRFSHFMTTAQDGGKVVSLTHRPPWSPGNAPGAHFYRRLSRPQSHCAIGKILCQWKIPMTPAGFKPATFRFVAQHLNNCATAVPHTHTHTHTHIYIYIYTHIHTYFNNETLSNLHRKAFKCIIYINFFAASNNCLVLQKLWYITGYKNVHFVLF